MDGLLFGDNSQRLSMSRLNAQFYRIRFSPPSLASPSLEPSETLASVFHKIRWKMLTRSFPVVRGGTPFGGALGIKDVPAMSIYFYEIHLSRESFTPAGSRIWNLTVRIAV